MNWRDRIVELDRLPKPRALPDETRVDGARACMTAAWLMCEDRMVRELLEEALESLAGEEPE